MFLLLLLGPSLVRGDLVAPARLAASSALDDSKSSNADFES